MMIKNAFNRRKPDPAEMNLKLDGVPSEVVYLAAEAITYGFRPEEMRQDFSKFDEHWFYDLSPAEQREKLGEYFAQLVRDDTEERFHISYDLMSSNYRSLQQRLQRENDL